MLVLRRRSPEFKFEGLETAEEIVQGEGVELLLLCSSTRAVWFILRGEDNKVEVGRAGVFGAEEGICKRGRVLPTLNPTEGEGGAEAEECVCRQLEHNKGFQRLGTKFVQ